MHYDIRGGRRLAAAVIAACALGAGASSARACDICAVYTATTLTEGKVGMWVGIASQFTRFGTLQLDGNEVDNPGEYVNSSITQLLFGYNPSQKLGLQVSVPVIVKDFRRQGDDGLESGTNSGIGDVAFTARWRAIDRATENTLFRLSALAGFKLPTGNTDALGEELEEDHDEVGAGGVGPDDGHDEDEGHEDDDEHEGHEASGVHGHDLNLGTGSYDGLVGATVFYSWKRLFFSAVLQYSLTSEGDFEYEYANSLLWRGGPGAYILLDPAYALSLQLDLPGETKGKDAQAGETVDDTAITALYAGPRLSFRYKRSISFELAGELPLIQHNSGLQIVPDYRIQTAFVWRF